MTTELICGLKLTHDGGVALVEVVDGHPRLAVSIEAEKIAEADRHATLADLGEIEEILSREGVTADEVDQFVVDGWAPTAVQDGLLVQAAGGPARIRTAPYRTSDDDTAVLHRYEPDDRLAFSRCVRRYSSFRHVTGHMAAAYLTSPAAAEGKSAFVLSWDGALKPELCHVDPARSRVTFVGELLNVTGALYAGFASTFDPFRSDPAWDEERLTSFHLSVAGKVMAYAGLGTVVPDLMCEMTRAFEHVESGPRPMVEFAKSVHLWEGLKEVSTADVLASFQTWLGDLLLSRLRMLIANSGLTAEDLCFTGGSALNIKWNSHFRDSGCFDRVWVPPFANDSGGAVGAACAELMSTHGYGGLQWSVYSGPQLPEAETLEGWISRPCTAFELGETLHETGQPIICLTGRAELGPRALGHRSILAAPADSLMRDRLNELKRREDYRPVAPICMVERSSEIFDPGGRDPHMLFDHLVRPDWTTRIPAVVHCDGTARLQTIDASEQPDIHEILRGYESASGIPVLCNTSANRPGRGFFPSLLAAANWGEIDMIWSDGLLHQRQP